MVHPFIVLMAYFRNLFGGQNDDGKESDNAAEVVEKLVERVETSTAYEDRRDALKALRSLAKKTRLPVATIGMAAYMEVLEKERSNPEIIAITLEILVAVVCDDDEAAGGTDELGERLSEIIVRRKGFISSIMSLVECYEFSVRRALVQLLTALLRHRASEVQNAIMSEPMGVSRLVDILHETREAVRNSAVLMLSELSRANSQIQQLLAYENAFQLLFDIIDVEPVDSIVIEDCLFVILNLLRKNSSNQQLFREASLIQRLATMLHIFLFGREGDEETESESEWPRQKIANVIFLLQVLRSLVSPRENVITNTHAAQKTINQSGMLGELCSVLLTELGVPVEVLTETIIAVAEVIRGNYTNQEYFAARHLLTNVGNRPSLLVLLMSMTTEKQPFKLRCAVFYCFLSYLYDNEFGKTKVIDTLLPSSATNDSQITTGQCICSAIMSSESVQVWMGCVCLMHCLFDADHLKEQLLRVQLTIDSAQAPSSLLRHIATLLVSLGNRKPQIRCALLMLLAVWLHGCPLAVAQFLQIEESVQYLTTHIDECGAEGTEDENQVTKGLMALVLAICLLYGDHNADKKNSLNVIVERRVGNEKIVELLEGVSRSEHYVRAAQRPQPLSKSAQEMLLDFQFTKLFKILEGQIVKQLRPVGDASSAQMNGGSDNVVASFKELIKRQDETIATLNQQIKKLTADLAASKANEGTEAERELAKLKQEMAERCQIENDRKQAEQPQIEHFRSIAEQWQTEAHRYQQWAEQWQQYQIAQLPNAEEVVVQQLSAQVKQLEEQLTYGWQSFEVQGASLAQTSAQLVEANRKIHDLEVQLAAAMSNAAAVDDSQTSNQDGLHNKGSDDEELASLKKEHEDLLVLLADQDAKLSQYRQRLIQLGQTVTDDEDDGA
uniref:Vesicle tethering protein Uso1/P115-like head domain-containing protein n=1 Tax=Ascaris lumbricoides TaxID=6252 RepID=A0A9J2PNX3_ASCLU